MNTVYGITSPNATPAWEPFQLSNRYTMMNHSYLYQLSCSMRQAWNPCSGLIVFPASYACTTHLSY